MAQRSKAVGIAVCIIAVACFVVTLRHCQVQAESRRATVAEAKIRSLVSIGMSEEEVVRQLTDAGFRAGPTIRPYEDADYLQIHVPIRDSMSLPETAEYTITGTTEWFGRKSYVVITLDLDGDVTAIK